MVTPNVCSIVVFNFKVSRARIKLLWYDIRCNFLTTVTIHLLNLQNHYLQWRWLLRWDTSVSWLKHFQCLPCMLNTNPILTALNKNAWTPAHGKLKWWWALCCLLSPEMVWMKQWWKVWSKIMFLFSIMLSKIV